MSIFGDNVDLNEVSDEMPSGAKFAFPVGTYTFTMTDSEEKESKKNSASEYLNLTFTAQGGEYGGEEFSVILNHKNVKPQVCAIAAQEFKCMCKAMGIDPNTVADPSQMYNMPLDIELKQEKSTYTVEGEERTSINNRVVKYLPVGGGSQQQASAQATAPAVDPTKPAYGQ